MPEDKADARAERNRAIEWVQNHLLPESYIWTVIRHRTPTASWVTLLAVVDNEIVDVTYYAARVLGVPLSPNYGGLKVTDQGVRPGFATVHELSWRMFGQDKDLHYEERTI